MAKGEWVAELGKKRFRIELTCGCSMKIRDLPRKNAFLSCPSGMGHGHKVRWFSAISLEDNRLHENPQARTR